MFRWTVLLTGGPKQGSNHAVAVGDNKVFAFGEFHVHLFNTESLRWRKLTPGDTMGRGERNPEDPFPCYDHTAVLVEDAIYLWGGWQRYELFCNVLYAFDVDTHVWLKHRVSGSVPERRENHSACALGKVMFIHGGYNGRLTNDTGKLDTTTMVWSLINTRGTPPSTSEGHSATIIGTKMFVFGGCTLRRGGQCYNTIRVFDTETNHWTNTPSAQLLPEGRHRHSAFAYNGELYIFGGYDDQGLTCGSLDLWRFNPGTFSWKKVRPKRKGPGPMSSVCCCMVGDRIILPGGHSDDLYVLDLSPSLKTLCKLAVIQYGLDQSELPHNVRWELAAMTSNRKRKTHAQ